MPSTKKNKPDQTWDMLQALIQQQNKLNADISRLSEITNEKFEKVNAETSKKIKEVSQKIKEVNDETSQKIKEVSTLIQASSIKTDKYLGKIREFDRNWGKLVESLVAPSIIDQFKKTSLEIDGMTQRVMKKKQDRTIEIDILLTNNTLIIPVEVKTTLNVQAVNDHIEKHLLPFKTFFPEYRDKIIYGAVAYIHVEENSDRYAYKKGLYVLTFGDNDLVVIKNDADFKPVAW